MLKGLHRAGRVRQALHRRGARVTIPFVRTPFQPPIEPMLAKLADELPPEGAFLYEPKWDGFRAIVFRGGSADVLIQSRDLRPLDR